VVENNTDSITWKTTTKLLKTSIDNITFKTPNYMGETNTDSITLKTTTKWVKTTLTESP
jgi:hypothetical protein